MTATPLVKRSRHSREYVKFELTTTPAVTAWDISFDDGANWYAGEAVAGSPGYYRWLVAGSDAPMGSAVTQLGPGSYAVLVRATDTPELVVRDLAVIEID